MEYISGTPKIFYPGVYENTLAVSAVGREGASMVFASSYSNYGSWIDISAPDTAIMSTIPGGYGGKTGTSMACSIVSGAVALLFSMDQTISFDDVKTLLSDSATDFGEAGYDEKYGHGVINVKALIDNYLVDKELPMPTAAVPDGSVVGAGDYELKELS